MAETPAAVMVEAFWASPEDISDEDRIRAAFRALAQHDTIRRISNEVYHDYPRYIEDEDDFYEAIKNWLNAAAKEGEKP